MYTFDRNIKLDRVLAVSVKPAIFRGLG